MAASSVAEKPSAARLISGTACTAASASRSSVWSQVAFANAVEARDARPPRSRWAFSFQPPVHGENAECGGAQRLRPAAATRGGAAFPYRAWWSRCGCRGRGWSAAGGGSQAGSRAVLRALAEKGLGFYRPLAYIMAMEFEWDASQVRRSGENRPPESDFRAFLRGASQQVCPENPRKPATQRGGRSGGEHGSYGNWRRRCVQVQAVSRLEPWRIRNRRDGTEQHHAPFHAITPSPSLPSIAQAPLRIRPCYA